MVGIGTKSIEDILAQLDEVSSIKGSNSTGATEKYLVKGELLSISSLAEGGFAEDIYFYKDYTNECVLFDYSRFAMLSRSDKKNSDVFEKMKVDNISKKLWYVTSGLRGNPWENMKDADKNMIIFSNGNWCISKKVEDGEVIPFLIAEEIDYDVAHEMTTKRVDDYKDDFINTREFANKIKDRKELEYSSGLLSRWEQDGLLHLMINTDLSNEYYLYNRMGDNIVITTYFNFEFMGTVNEKVKDELKLEIFDGFKKWNKDYMDKDTDEYQGSEFVELGGKTVNVQIIPKESKNGIPVKVTISSYETGEVEASNRDMKDDGWGINDVGIMRLWKKENYEGHFKFIVAHELGHVMGLGDAYDTAYLDVGIEKDIEYTELEIPSNSIMFGIEALSHQSNYIITPNDIEMLQYANVLCEKQYFYGPDRSIGVIVGGEK